MALRDLAVHLLTYLRDVGGRHVSLFWKRELCRLAPVQRSKAVLLIALLLIVRDTASALPFSVSAGSSTVPQAQVVPVHLKLHGVRQASELHFVVRERRDLYPMSAHLRICQRNRRDTQTDIQKLFCTASSASHSLLMSAGWQLSCQATASIRTFVQPSVGGLGWPCIPFPESPQRSHLLHGRVPSLGHSNLSLQASYLSVCGATREGARLSVSYSLATATTATAVETWDQEPWPRNSARNSPRWTACPGGPLLRKSNLPRKACSSAVLRSFVGRTACPGGLLLRRSNLRRKACPLAVLRGFVGEEHNVNSLSEEGFSASSESANVDEGEDDSHDTTEELQEHSPKRKKDDFETAVSDDVLRDMVRLQFLYNEEDDEKLMQAAAPFVIDGSRFNGFSPFASPPWGPMERMVPHDRSLASVPPLADELSTAAPPALKSVERRNSTERVHDFWKTLAKRTANWDFYMEPGSRVQSVANNAVLVTPPINPNRAFLWVKQDIERGAYEDAYADGTVRYEMPTYLNPVAPALRTGRRRDAHRKTDTGKKQKERWGMENIQGDIPRGKWTFTNDIYKDMLDSVDWEREWPHLHDKNYYKRSHYSTLTGDNDRNEDSYWDPQFIGAVDTYPRVLPAGMNFTWPVYWIPWLCKKHPRRGGQPLKSEPFNLGGVEPLQLWFYPDGCELSHPGFCSVKLVSRPGWNLPFRIKMWIQGSTVDIPVGRKCLRASSSSVGPSSSDKGDTHSGRRDEVRSGEGVVGRIETAAGGVNSQRRGPFVSRVEVGPVRREEADYVAYSTSFCRLLDKKKFLRLWSFPFPPFGKARPPLPVCYNPATDVVMRAAGDVDIGVAVAEENWEWDDGHWSVEQWLKLQSAYPDDLELEETLPAGFTNSDMFENYKYRDVPDKHYAKYLPSALPPSLKGEDFDQTALNRRHAY